jgi:hypothetical protein
VLSEIPLFIKGKGRPPGDICSRLAIRFEDPVSGKKYWRCVAWRNEGQGKCDILNSGNPAEKRVLAHSVKCLKLSDEQRKWALNKNASCSLGAKVQAAESKSAVNLKNSGPRTSRGTAESAPNPMVSLVHDFTKAGQAQWSQKINHCILKLICV